MTLIKREDTVKILTGKSKGKTGKVIKVLRLKNQVIVEGANRAKRHEKANAKNEQGGIVDKDMPIHVSNVMVISPKTNKPSKLVRLKSEKGKWVRAEQKSKAIID